MSLLEHACTIDGWTSPDELRWLHDACAGKPLVIEFGAWLGRSTVAMCSAERVVSVDTWTGSPGEEEHQRRIADGLNVWGKWCLNTATYSTKIDVQAGDLRSESFRDLLVRRYGLSADLVFIDASHDEPSVRKDIALARRLLKPDGVLCGHDYGGGWQGVKAAVDAIVPRAVVAVGSIWKEGA